MMAQKFSITLYCGASAECAPFYIDLAHKFGDFIGKNGWRMHFGAGRKGLMGAAARACLKAGGEAYGYGFENEFLSKTEPPLENLTKLSIEPNIHHRKLKMHTCGSVIVILPGGLGTLDEFFEALTWQYLGINQSPVWLLNENGYWDILLNLLDHMEKEKFIKDVKRLDFKSFDKLEALQSALKEYSHTAIPKPGCC